MSNFISIFNYNALINFYYHKILPYCHFKQLSQSTCFFLRERIIVPILWHLVLKFDAPPEQTRVPEQKTDPLSTPAPSSTPAPYSYRVPEQNTLEQTKGMFSTTLVYFGTLIYYGAGGCFSGQILACRSAGEQVQFYAPFFGWEVIVFVNSNCEIFFI